MNQHDSAFWGLTIAKYYAWPFSQISNDRWRDDLTQHFSLPNDLKEHCTQSSGSLRQTQAVTLCFFMLIIFASTLKNVKIPNCKQQFTAAICLNKGCPDYPPWEGSTQQRLIRNFNSSTLNNSLYCTIAVKSRQTFVMMFAMSHPVAVVHAVWLSEPCLWLTERAGVYVHRWLTCNMEQRHYLIYLLVVPGFVHLLTSLV